MITLKSFVIKCLTVPFEVQSSSRLRSAISYSTAQHREYRESASLMCCCDPKFTFHFVTLPVAFAHHQQARDKTLSVMQLHQKLLKACSELWGQLQIGWLKTKRKRWKNMHYTELTKAWSLVRSPALCGYSLGVLLCLFWSEMAAGARGDNMRWQDKLNLLGGVHLWVTVHSLTAAALGSPQLIKQICREGSELRRVKISSY